VEISIPEEKFRGSMAARLLRHALPLGCRAPASLRARAFTAPPHTSVGPVRTAASAPPRSCSRAGLRWPACVMCGVTDTARTQILLTQDEIMLRDTVARFAKEEIAPIVRKMDEEEVRACALATAVDPLRLTRLPARARAENGRRSAEEDV
jgi:hypothetical protein